MKKTLSLKNSSDFQRILKRGYWYSGDVIITYIMPNKKSINFLGIAVSKHGLNSVQRNRVKRLIRENYRNVENNLKVGYNIVVLWKSKATFEKAIYANIQCDMQKCFKKANILI